MEDSGIKPFISIPIPGPIISLSPIPLLIMYTFVAYFDYYLFCRTSIPYQKYKNWLRIFHIIIPLLVASKAHAFSTPFISFPWFIASVGSYTSLLYKEEQVKAEKQSHQSFKEWMKSVAIEGLTRSEDVQANGDADTKRQIRIEGMKRVVVCTLTNVIAHFLLNPFLLEHPEDFLKFPWYSVDCMYYGFLIGLKGYILFLSNDLISGAAQAVTGTRLMHLFNKPFMATSPKDFWGNRWNLVVRNLFRKQIYVGKKDPKDSVSTLAMKRLRAFFKSALMHEFIMAFVNRSVTFEQFTFFMLNGLIVYLQTLVPRSFADRVPTWLCRLMTLTFLSLISKLFIAPYMRYEEQRILFGRHSPF